MGRKAKSRTDERPSAVKRKRAKYRVTNWKSYNASLVARGSLTIWLSAEALASWTPQVEGRRGRGGQMRYSEQAIECLLTLRAVLSLPLRAMEGFGQSVLHLLGASERMPDYTTLCKRSRGLKVCIPIAARTGPLHVVIDSTGLKIYGEGEWKVRKFGYGKHRTWRKLHLCVNPDTHQIEAATLTVLAGQDAQAGSQMLDSLHHPIDFVAGDGAYDKLSFYQTCQRLHIPFQAVPPRRDATIIQHGNCAGPSLSRDQNLRAIRRSTRRAWKRRSGYHRRSLAEVAVFRFKTIFGGQLQARTFDRQLSEALIKCKALNMMTRLGMPVSQLVA